MSLGAVVAFYGNVNAHESDGRPRPCAIMSRSQRIVAQDAWNSMAVYEISDGALVHRFGSGGWVRRFAITQDDRYALLCSASGELHLWDVEAGERLWHQLAGLGSLHDASFSGNGEFIIAGGDLCTVGVFRTRTGELIRRIAVPNGCGSVMAVTLSPDGTVGAIVTLAQVIYTFDVESGKMQNLGIGASAPARFLDDAKSIACSTPDQMRGVQLRLITLGEKATCRDMGQFEDIRILKPLEDGGLLIIAGPHAGAERVERYDVLTDQLVPVCELRPDGVGDVSIKRQMAVLTDWLLVTRVVDMRTGDILLEIDNQGNRRPPSMVWRGAILIILVLAMTAGVILVHSWYRSGKANPNRS